MPLIYNKLYKETIVLNEDQHTCPRCKGNGYSEKYDTEDDGEPYGECTVCHGDGYVDWARLPFLSAWEDRDIQWKENAEASDFEEEFWEEIDDQETGSFIVDIF